MSKPFRDRTEAGRRLAERLKAYADGRDVIVLAPPRGGVPVGADEALEIESATGTTLLRLRSAMLPEMVDGIL